MSGTVVLTLLDVGSETCFLLSRKASSVALRFAEGALSSVGSIWASARAVLLVDVSSPLDFSPARLFRSKGPDVALELNCSLTRMLCLDAVSPLFS